jgi:hypothetical protein
MDPITWQAPEFIKYEKPKGWYMAVWIIAIALAVVGFLTKSVFMIVLVVVAGLLVTLYGAKSPKILSFVLSEKSLTIQKREYPLEDFSSFWIFPDEEWHTLSLNHKKRTKQHLKILVPTDIVRRVRQLTIGVLLEEEQQRSALEEFADKLRF